MEKERFDVLIIGGGLAGLTLALQLIMKESALSILVLERRKNDAPTAAHKVGESVVELGAHYLRNDLQLKDYLEANHLPKFGFRFFLDSPRKGKLQNRIEIGSITEKQAPSHHIDRGLIENDLVELLTQKGVKVQLDSTVEDLVISKSNHQIKYAHQDKEFEAEAEWVVDASGRRSFLKRKLKLQKETDHSINSAWFRIKQPLDVGDWSDSEDWKSKLPSQYRRLSTNHFMAQGYWIWIIPLVNGSTSVGIVADPTYHDFEQFNTLDKAFEWIKECEPVVYENICSFRNDVLDFRVTKNFSLDSKQFFSSDKWAITGEAGAFLDPFYSPGTDFIALNNTWITDLIYRDFNKENISLNIQIYENTQRHLIKGWFSLYKDLYLSLSSSQVMLAKIIWDWSTYWAVITPLFINKGFTNVNVMRAYASNESSLGFRFNALNNQLQKLLTDWTAFDSNNYDAEFINVFDVSFLYQFHLELQEKLDENQLIDKISSNIETLEFLAVELFRRAYNLKYHTNYIGAINPYKMDLTKSNSSGYNDFKSPDEKVQKDLEIIWLKPSENNPGDSRPNNVNLKRVEQIFLTVQREVDNYEKIKDLNCFLENYHPDFRSIAYESASFAIGLKDLKENNNLENWIQFLTNASNVNLKHVEIGLGWSFAAINENPLKHDYLAKNEFLLDMVMSGVGYYHALYKQKKTLTHFEIWEHLDAQKTAAYDQGIGRRIWYHCESELQEAQELIDKFPECRRADLWRGVGLACGYVGGLSTDHLNRLEKFEEHYSIYLKSGILLTSIYNIKAERFENEPLDLMDALYGFSKEDLDYLASQITENQSINMILPKIELLVNQLSITK
jgi:flavin-dependent dehydrogenase